MKILFLSDLRKKRNTGFEIIRNLKEMDFEVYPLNIKGFFSFLKIKKILKEKKPEILFTFKGIGKIDFKKIEYEFKNKILWYPDTDLFLNDKFNENLRDIFDYHENIFVIMKSKINALKEILRKENIYYMVQGARFFEYKVREIPEKFKCDIGFIGSLNGEIYSKRREILSRVCEFFKDKYKIKLFGQKIKKGESFYEILNKFHSGEKVYFENFKKVCLGSKIIIDIGSNASCEEIGAISQKVFMITGCGGFLILHYIKGIENFFEIGKEIEVFRNIDELFKKIDYYMENKEEREKIAKRGMKKTLKEHTYKKRIEKIFEICRI
jgi:spore maturation protein CgeB